MRRINFVILIILAMVFTSCGDFADLFKNSASAKNGDKKRIEESFTDANYSKETLWTCKTGYPVEVYPTKKDNYYYIVDDYSDSSKSVFDIAKIDLDSGKRIWTTDKIGSMVLSSPVIVEYKNIRYVFIVADNGNILGFKDCGDAVERTVHIKILNYRQNVTNQAVFYNEKFYWTFIDGSEENKTFGIACLDFNEIDFLNAEAQIIDVSSVYETDNNQGMLNYIVGEDGIIYFMTFNPHNKNPNGCMVAAYDAQNEKIKWKHNFTCITGGGENNILIEGNNLYVVQNEIICLDKRNGNIKYVTDYQNIDTTREIQVYASNSSSGITYYDDKLYFTNQNGWCTSAIEGMPESLVKNIECVNAKDGKLIWGDLPFGSGSLYSRPVIIDGLCYVVTWNQLRVYEADNGKLICIDDSIHTQESFEKGASYNGAYIFFTRDENKQWYLKSVRLSRN